MPELPPDGQTAASADGIITNDSSAREGKENSSPKEEQRATDVRKRALEASGHWQLFSVSLHRGEFGDFGIAISGGVDNPHYLTGDSSIVISDVVCGGPAFGLLHIDDKIVSANGVCMENADYGSAVTVMREAPKLDMMVQRKVPPSPQPEQRTLKFTLSKSRKKDDFGIVLGCRYFIKEITNPKLAEKDPGLREGDTVLRINGQPLDEINLEEAARLLHRSRDKLSLVVQRDVKCRGMWTSNGSRWPSQTTVYERLGSRATTPRQSPTPVHHSMTSVASPCSETHSYTGRCRYHYPPTSSAYSSPGLKRCSEPVSGVQMPHTPTTLHMHRNSMQTPVHSTVHRQPQPIAGWKHPHNYYSTPAHSNRQVTQCPLRPSTPSSVITAQSSAAGSPHGSLFTNEGCNEGCSTAPTTPLQPYPHQHTTDQLMHTRRPRVTAAQMQGRLAGPNDFQVVSFRKGPGSLGIRVVGGNQVGIFVSAVQEDSIAGANDIRVGDRLRLVNGHSLDGTTREEAVEYLLGLTDEVCIHLERQGLTNAEGVTEFARVRDEQLGDSFYIRTHFPYQRRANREISFQPGDIFHVTDTLCGGSVGHWQATKIYSGNEAEKSVEPVIGMIPNAKSAELFAKQAQMDSFTLGRSTLKKKLIQSLRAKPTTAANPGAAAASMLSAEDELLGSCANGTPLTPYDIPLPAYERVALKRPAFLRPIVLFGPLADVARQLLLTNFPTRFGSPQPLLHVGQSPASDEQVVRLSGIDSIMSSQRHCVLNLSPSSVERLQLAQYAPIVIMLGVDSKSRVKELRARCGADSTFARKLMEQASKIKRHHSQLLTATLDASKEDAWFEALRHLILHLQERRVWMPEFGLAQPVGDLVLFPMPGVDVGEDDSIKEDYGTYDATTRSLASESLSKENHVVPMKDRPNSQLINGLPPMAELSSPTNFRKAIPSPAIQSPPLPRRNRAKPSDTSPFLNPGNKQNCTNSPASPTPLPETAARDIREFLAEHYPAGNGRAMELRTPSESTPCLPLANGIAQTGGELPPDEVKNFHGRSEEFDNVRGMPSIGCSPTGQRPGTRRKNDTTQLNAPHIDELILKLTAQTENGDNQRTAGEELATTTAHFDLVKEPRNSSPLKEDQLAIAESVCAVLDWRGCHLTCPQSGVELIVPRLAIPCGQQHEVFVKLCRESLPQVGCERGVGNSQPLTVVICGPAGLKFATAVKLRLPHAAKLDLCTGGDATPNYILKTSSSNDLKSMELLRAPYKANPEDGFVTALLNHF